MAKEAVRDVPVFLAEQQKKYVGELSQEWANIEELYNKKLWHQLTLKIQQFVKHPSMQGDNTLVKMYHNFIADFEHRINPLALMEIVSVVVRQIKDTEEALKFLERTKDKIKDSVESKILCIVSTSNIKLQNKDMQDAKELIEEAQTLLDSIDGVSAVHGRFYELSSNYHKLMGNHASYYRDALRYLGCTELATIPGSELADRAVNISLAAILGDGVYNFGELLAHDILSSLNTSDKRWLSDLLYAFNSGDLNKFESLKTFWQAQPDLAVHERLMRQKISLLCLMEMTFKRASNDRLLTFEEIATETRLPIEEVELLVMKALSLGLVKGSIDQVEQKVLMTWVQPRVLDESQISGMQQRLAVWCDDVKNMGLFVEDRAQDILT